MTRSKENVSMTALNLSGNKELKGTVVRALIQITSKELAPVGHQLHQGNRNGYLSFSHNFTVRAISVLFIHSNIVLSQIPFSCYIGTHMTLLHTILLNGLERRKK